MVVELPKTLTDNEIGYLTWLEGINKYGDPLSEISIRRKDNGLQITIKPSSPELKQDIIRNHLEFNELLGFKISYSKSLALSKLVSYFVKFDGTL